MKKKSFSKPRFSGSKAGARTKPGRSSGGPRSFGGGVPEGGWKQPRRGQADGEPASPRSFDRGGPKSFDRGGPKSFDRGGPKSFDRASPRSFDRGGPKSFGGPKRFDRGGGFNDPSVGTKVVGRLKLHPDGFGFVQPDGKVPAIFLPEREAARALDGDRLEVEIVPGNDGRTAGRVVGLVGRQREQVIGTYFEEDGKAFVKPRDPALGPVRVPPTQIARHGDVVKVRLGIGGRLLDEREWLTGEVSGSMGRVDDRSAEVLSLAYAKGFNDEFPPEVMDEADGFDVTIDVEAALAEGRTDLRQMSLVTIDGADAKDFDDAICVVRSGAGYTLTVAIADVAWYVRPGSALNDEAQRRGTSVYLPGRVLPMLPERLSNGLCSLRPDEDRLCLVAEIELDEHGVPQREKVFPGLMRSHARLTYDQVQVALETGALEGREALVPMLELSWELASKLKAKRAERGAIDFDLPETKVELDAEGAPVKLVRRDRLDAHKLIEEHMLAANEAVARWFKSQDLPVVNRYHGPPDEEKLESFSRLARAHGLAVPKGVPTSKQLDALLKQLEGHSEQRALNQLLLRSMMQAVYSAEQTGHYGLAAEDYLHFTSPIRRYPDLLVHRGLWQHWRGEREEQDLQELATSASDRERAAAQTEREVTQLYACLIAQKHIGEEHPGAVTALTENGAFVELTDLFLEGMWKPAEGARFDANTFRMFLGRGRELRLGDPMTVQITEVNLRRRQIDLEAIGEVGRASRDETPVEISGDDEQAFGRSNQRRTGYRPPPQERPRPAYQASSEPAEGEGDSRPPRDLGPRDKFGNPQRFGGRKGIDESRGPKRFDDRRGGGGFGGPKRFDKPSFGGPKRFEDRGGEGGGDRFGGPKKFEKRPFGGPKRFEDRGGEGGGDRFGGPKKFEKRPFGGPKRFEERGGEGGGDRFGGPKKFEKRSFGGPKRFEDRGGEGGGGFGGPKRFEKRPFGGPKRFEERGEGGGGEGRFGGPKKFERRSFGGPKRFEDRGGEGGGFGGPKKFGKKPFGGPKRFDRSGPPGGGGGGDLGARDESGKLRKPFGPADLAKRFADRGGAGGGRSFGKKPFGGGKKPFGKKFGGGGGAKGGRFGKPRR